MFGTAHILSQWLLLLAPSYWVRLFAFALMGFFQLKNSVCYTWLFSLVHSKDKQGVCSFLNAFDTATLCVTCLYFIFISKEWFYLYLFMTTLGTLSYLAIMVLVPEAPRWSIINGRSSEAIESFNMIARVNRSRFFIDK